MSKRIFYNGLIMTLDPTCPRVQAIYVEEGRVVALGTNEEILLQFGRDGIEKIDLDGGYGYPGLVDSHLHLAMLGKKKQQLNLTDCRSKEEFLQRVRQRAERTKPMHWVIGNGWDDSQLPQLPTIDELESASLGRPVLLWRNCQHVCLVNRTAYRLAGVREDSEPPQGGVYGRDEDGRLNGWIYENASLPFVKSIPPLTLEEQKAEIRAAMQEALSLGLTGVHTDDLREIGSVKRLLTIYQELQQHEGIALRTHHLLYHPYIAEWDALGGHHLRNDQWFSFGAVKLFADGSLGGRTALLSEPYHDDEHHHGVAAQSWEQLAHLVSQAKERQLPVAVHAIGDQAIEKTLAILQRFRGDAEPPLRHRLIHAQILRASLIEQLREMPIAVDIQPRFAVSDFPWVIERIGDKRLRYAYAWRTLLDAGICCAGGSDSPIEPLSPLLGIHAAVTRCHPDNAPAQSGYQPEQRLDRLQALALFTTGSAYAANEEYARGTLSVGKQADLSVFDRDLLTIPPEEIVQAKTHFTIVNGELAYQK